MKHLKQYAIGTGIGICLTILTTFGIHQLQKPDYIYQTKKISSDTYTTKVDNSPYGGVIGKNVELSFDKIISTDLEFIRRTMKKYSDISSKDTISEIEIRVKK